MRMGSGRRAALAAVIGAVLLVPLTTSALAADATGCSGSAISFDADGIPIDNVKAPGEGGTQADPFLIDLDGEVAWVGSTSTVLTDATWSVNAGGIPILSGEFANEEGKTKDAGRLSMSSTLPGPVAALLKGSQVVPVSGSIVSAAGTCEGSGYISAGLPAFGTPMWITAIVLIVISLLLLGFLLLHTEIIIPGITYAPPL